MNLQVLISTMHQKNYSLLNKMNINSDVIVINQCVVESISEFDFNGNNVKWINCNERGLSKSRNVALSHSTGDICVLADDDLEYVENYKEIILDQFLKNPDADIITFQVEGIEKNLKIIKIKFVY